MRHNDFDRSFNRTRNIVFAFIGFVFVAILVFWLSIGYIAVQVAKHPELIGESAGKVINGFENVRKDR